MLKEIVIKGGFLIINTMIVKQLEGPLINIGKVLITKYIPQIIGSFYQKIQGEKQIRYF